MTELLDLVSETTLAVAILIMWVVSLHRKEAKLLDRLIMCVDELKHSK